MREPLRSTGWVIHTCDGINRFAGTCFAFRRPHFLLTAAHCIGDLDPQQVSVSIMTDRVERGLEVRRIVRHGAADVALLELESRWAEVFDPFLGETSLFDWGMPVSAFGYPEDTGATGLEPTPRYFRGNIQRLFRHHSLMGYDYEAVELSFGAPAGLSGGPVSPQVDYSMAMGLVAENITSSTYLSTITEVREGGNTHSEHIHSVINYAIAVRLDVLKPWLDDLVPYPTYRIAQGNIGRLRLVDVSSCYRKAGRRLLCVGHTLLESNAEPAFVAPS